METVPSPVLANGRLFFVRDGGLASCYEPATGKPIYEGKRIGTGDAYYASSPSLNPAGPASGATRVLRGGNVLIPQYFARSAFRLDLPPSTTGHGFRLARVA